MSIDQKGHPSPTPARAGGRGASLFAALWLLGCGEAPPPAPLPPRDIAPAPAATPTSAPATTESSAQAIAPPSVDIPYQLALEPFTIPGFPGLHSMVYAVYNGKLILIAGRRNGLHAFPPQCRAELIAAFPPQLANDRVWILDLAKGTLLGDAPVTGLPKSIANQLSATNLQFVTKDGWLYIAGGYGSTSDGQSMLTLGQALAVNLDALVKAVTGKVALDKAFADKNIHVGSHPALKVTGGAMKVIGGNFLLIFGHQYDGLYTPDSASALQTYSQSVRAFQFGLPAGPGGATARPLKVDYKGKDPATDPLDPVTDPKDPDNPYHRRDLTVIDVLSPDGSLRVGAFGGVFKGGRMEGFTHPIYISSSTAPLGFTMSEDTKADQLLSQYEAAAVPIYSTRDKAMYVTFFGGISQFYWDAASRSLKRDAPNFNQNPPVDGLPFINSVSTLRAGADGTGDFLHEGESFPPSGGEPTCEQVKMRYLGAESTFVPADSAPMQDHAILIDKITQPQVIGYVIGGIAAAQPYPGKQTCASGTLYRVTLKPGTPTKTVRLKAP